MTGRISAIRIITHPFGNNTILGNRQDARNELAFLELLVVALDYSADRESIHGLIRDVTRDVTLESWPLHAVAHVRVEAHHERLNNQALGRWRGDVEGAVLEDHVHTRPDHALRHLLVDEGLVTDERHYCCWMTELRMGVTEECSLFSSDPEWVFRLGPVTYKGKQEDPLHQT